MTGRRPYPSDLSDARWALIEPSLTAWQQAQLAKRAIIALIRDRLANKAPLPDEDEVRKRLHLGQPVDNP